jgi:hypothetical protein
MASLFAMCTRCYQVENAPAVRCPKCGHDRIQPLHQTTGLTLAGAREFVQSLASSGDRKAHLKRRWIVTFGQCMQASRSGNAVPEATVALFWVRLWGIVVELPKSMQISCDFFAAISDDDPTMLSPVMRAIANWHRRSKTAIDGIRSALSDDMLLYLEWRRHVECHMEQSAFMVQLNGKPDAWKSAKTRSTFKTVGREVGVQECWEALERVSKDYGDDNDHAVMRAFATAISEPAFELVDAWMKFDKEVGT